MDFNEVFSDYYNDIFSDSTLFECPQSDTKRKRTDENADPQHQAIKKKKNEPTPPATTVTKKEKEKSESYWEDRKKLCDMYNHSPIVVQTIRNICRAACLCVMNVSFDSISKSSVAPPTLLINCLGAIINGINQAPWGTILIEKEEGKEKQEEEENFIVWVSGEYGEPDYPYTIAQKKFRTALIIKFQKMFEEKMLTLLKKTVKICFVGKFKLEKDKE